MPARLLCGWGLEDGYLGKMPTACANTEPPRGLWIPASSTGMAPRPTQNSPAVPPWSLILSTPQTEKWMVLRWDPSYPLFPTQVRGDGGGACVYSHYPKRTARCKDDQIGAGILGRTSSSSTSTGPGPPAPHPRHAPRRVWTAEDAVLRRSTATAKSM